MYIRENNLPYNKERYDNKDETFNNDLFPTCHDCLNYNNEGKEIFCMKSGKNIKFRGKSKEENEKLREQLLGIAYK
jgi:hypothetical protein